jgi:hypothetical protein
MEDLRIEDGDGDGFTLRASMIENRAYAATLIPTNDMSVGMSADDCQDMIQWLNELLGGELLEAEYAMLTLRVPGAAGGEPRELTWSGPGDAPGWLVSLANIAMGGTAEQPRVRAVRAENELEDTIVLLGQARARALQAEDRAEEVRTKLRQVLRAIGAGNPDRAIEIMQENRRQLDGVTGALLSVLSLEADPNGHDLANLVRRVERLGSQRVLAAKQNYEAELARQRLMAEQALSTERDARAALQVGYDGAMVALSSTEARLKDAQQGLRDARDELEALVTPFGTPPVVVAAYNRICQALEAAEG